MRYDFGVRRLGINPVGNQRRRFTSFWNQDERCFQFSIEHFQSARVWLDVTRMEIFLLKPVFSVSVDFSAACSKIAERVPNLVKTRCQQSNTTNHNMVLPVKKKLTKIHYHWLRCSTSENIVSRFRPVHTCWLVRDLTIYLDLSAPVYMYGLCSFSVQKHITISHASCLSACTIETIIPID